MSVKLSSYVWDGCASSGMKLSSVAIMARLADFSNDEGVCWPSIETIARQIGAGASTVRTAVAKLEAEGWLSRTARRKGNRNASNVYRLNVAKLQAAAFAHLSESDTSKTDGSKSVASKFDGSKLNEESGFDPAESGGDPSVKSKQDPSEVKDSRQPAAQTDREVEITDQAKQVLSHLNLVTGSRYQVSKSSMENIRARLGEEFSLEDLNLVVDYSQAKWGHDIKMAEYLRPVTLFQISKFPGYLQSATKWHAAGRPENVNGKWVKAGETPVGDTRERDEEYGRYMRGLLLPNEPSELALRVCKAAGAVNLRNQRPEFAMSRWNAIWKEQAQRGNQGEAA
ncbi:conserved phage C-terminal domain-containing protein [Buttiauxella massiliensis]|uniref:conserved phage C-terminal domain-containing protein n=1 Tax=Buttiauxella massiliensis TaxID=2831590 RepID=UPI00125F351F|nr:conserved phage C-terminal domain-containing protein [Buttiauxella massiliensis]